MTTDTEFSRLLYKVARAYYDDGLTQQQIGERFGLSRVKVSRLLRSAREQKVVQITIAPPQSSNTQLEQQLEHRYGRKEALVVTPSSYTPAVLVAELGPVAAACLMRGLRITGITGTVTYFGEGDGTDRQQLRVLGPGVTEWAWSVYASSVPCSPGPRAIAPG